MPTGHPRKSEDVIEYICIECKKVFYRNNNHDYKFCSTTCNYANKKGKKQPEGMGAKISKTKLSMGLTGNKSHMWGRKHSEETKKKIKEGMTGLVRRPWTDEEKRAVSRRVSGKGNPMYGKMAQVFKDTVPERKVEEILKALDIVYEKQFRIQNKYYDFYIPSKKLLIEVDGVYWHGKYEGKAPKNIDEVRENDRYKNQLAEDYGFKIIRLWEDELVDCEEIINGKIRDGGM